MDKKEVLDSINKRLIQYYGHHVSANLPNFRLVWSTDQKETRRIQGLSLYPEFKEVPKYPFYPDVFVFEKYTEIGPQRELMNISGYSYEPLWVFHDWPNGQKKVPTWEAIQYFLKNAVFNHREKRNESMDRKAYDEEIEAEAKENYDFLDAHMRSYSGEVVNKD